MAEQPFSLENLARQDPQYLVQTIKEQRDEIEKLHQQLRVAEEAHDNDIRYYERNCEC